MTADYKWGFGVENDTLYRNGKRVGGIAYSEMMDTATWWYNDPLGYLHFSNFDDSSMTPMDLQRKVMFAYEDKEEA